MLSPTPTPTTTSTTFPNNTATNATVSGEEDSEQSQHEQESENMGTESVASGTGATLRPKGHAKSASVSGRSSTSSYGPDLHPIDSTATLTDSNRPRSECFYFFLLLSSCFLTFD